jgi:DUF4097 and DUF4098 domain-containing protein YvlB
MESKNRTVWIVLVVLLVIACCCFLALAAGAVGWLTTRDVDFGEEPFDLGGQYRERVEETVEAGPTPSLEIVNFAGAVTIRPGEGDVVRVVATKKTSRRDRLERIEVHVTQDEGRVVIKTKKAFSTGNASVELDITAPPGSQVDLETGAGTVDVRDITGQLVIVSGAGTVNVRGAQDAVRVMVGAGQITYEGTPTGSCRFETGAGEIVLRLPEDPDVDVDLGSGMGAVDVDFYVVGRVMAREVVGVIGDGSQGSIHAHTGVGAVRVRRR